MKSTQDMKHMLTQEEPAKKTSLLWDGLNFTAIAGTTSVAIVAVQSPIRSMITNLSAYHSLLPPANTLASSSTLSIARHLYTGTAASFFATAVRTTSVKSTKKLESPQTSVSDSSHAEEASRPIAQPFSAAKMSYVATSAAGDVLVTQIPESLSQLKKSGVLPVDFKWRTPRNALGLISGGFVPRYLAGIVNIGCMTGLEGKYANALSVTDSKLKHTVAGTLSGMTAATLSYPFLTFKDYVLAQAKISSGKLVNRSSIDVMKEMSHSFLANPKAITESFLKTAAKAMPLRVGLSGLIFGMFSGITSALGDEPLKSVVPDRVQAGIKADSNLFGFFNPSTTISPDDSVGVPRYQLIE